jgi:hypothetical protein
MLGMSFGIRSSRGIAESWCKRSRSKCSGPGRCVQFWKHGLVSRHNDLCKAKLESAFTFTFILFFQLFLFPFVHPGSVLHNHHFVPNEITDDVIINVRF